MTAPQTGHIKLAAAGAELKREAETVCRSGRLHLGWQRSRNLIFTHLYWRGPETFGWGVGRVKAVAPSLPAAGSMDLVDRCGVASWRWSRAMGRARTVGGYKRENGGTEID